MINLLPIKEKINLAGEKKIRLLTILGFSFLIFVLSLFLALLAIKIYINGAVRAQDITLRSEEEKAGTIEAQNLLEVIEDTNETLSKLNSFYREQISLIYIFEKISGLLPQGIHLTNLNYQNNVSNFSIIISGISPTRGTLLEFKNNLKEEEIFQEVDFPSSSWIRSVDVEFNVTLKTTFSDNE